MGVRDTIPGAVLRARVGDVLRVDLTNGLPEATTIHWHGIALRNDMDCVPGMIQAPVKTGERFTYEFALPDPGTYFFHPHNALQLDRGLYAPLSSRTRTLPGETRVVELDAENPGQWMLHCHNTYHLERGMATVLSYRR